MNMKYSQQPKGWGYKSNKEEEEIGINISV